MGARWNFCAAQAVAWFKNTAKHNRSVKRIYISFMIENELSTKLRDAGLHK